jgi:hypothetical protein
MTCVICSKTIPTPPPLEADYLKSTDWSAAYKEWSLRRVPGNCECRRCDDCWGLKFRHVQGNRHKCQCAKRNNL